MSEKNNNNIPTDGLHNKEPGYVQSVANAAYIVVKRVDDMFEEMYKAGEPERLNNYLEAIANAPDDIFESLLNPDIQVLDQIAEQVVPQIEKEYGVEPTDISADICLLVDYYTALSLTQQNLSADEF